MEVLLLVLTISSMTRVMPNNSDVVVNCSPISIFHWDIPEAFWMIWSMSKECPLKKKKNQSRLRMFEYLYAKIQQTKLLVTCQEFSDLFLFGLVWQYSSVQTIYDKGRFKGMATYLQQYNIALSLPSYTGSALKRELNICNGCLSLLYFCLYVRRIHQNSEKTDLIA